MKLKFIKLRMILNIILNRPVICNSIFRGEIIFLSGKGIISNNKFVD